MPAADPGPRDAGGSQCQRLLFLDSLPLRNAPYNPVPEKYDLTALPNKTVTFYVTDTGPSIYSGNDSFASVISQIRQAAGAFAASLWAALAKYYKAHGDPPLPSPSAGA